MLRRTILTANQRRTSASCQAALIDARQHSLDEKNDEPSRAARRRHDQSQSLRSFHSTRRNEILPLIAAGAVVGIGVYSVKALRRMDEDWDEYQWQLEQYEKQLARTNPTEQVSKAMAIDLGSVYCKLATSHPQPSVVVSREGDRAFFNGIVNDGTHVIRGRAALERFYYATEGDEASLVQMPWISLTESNAGEVVYEAVSPAIKEAIEMLDYRNVKTDEPLRKIVTVPVHFQDPFVDAFDNVLPDNQATFLPNPVAAIWGAQTRGILPTDDEKIKKAKTFLVVDVGGMVTQISIVQKDIVLGSLSIPWGGETYIQILVELLLKDAPIELHDARSLSALQTQARLAIMELSNKTRAAIHVPYLFPDPKNHHLDTTMSRIVVEQAMNEHVNKDLAVDFGDLRVLSPHMPVPTTVSSLFQSLVTQVLEEGRKMPADIDHVLVVGGGSKTHQVQDAVSSTLAMLMGGDGPKKLAIPDSVLQTELTVLGAATMLPSYEYHIDSGLRRIDSE
ncbi:hypothetical protein MPSEU_000789300 [Mayamaea pseudoterrestris]|nr:hypothetical protein MPSEU_000789300 [Mayamaea pseudoterrestris]